MPSAQILSCVGFVAYFALGCGAGDIATESPVPQPATQRGGPYSLDRIELSAQPDLDLVEINGHPAITVGSFNRRLHEFRIADEGQGIAKARSQVLDQMIDQQLIVRAARQALPQSAAPSPVSDDPDVEDRVLAHNFIRHAIGRPDRVSSREAEAFYAEHKGEFPELTEPLAEDELFHVKIIILDKRWRAKLASWRSQVDVKVSRELLEAS